MLILRALLVLLVWSPLHAGPTKAPLPTKGPSPLERLGAAVRPADLKLAPVFGSPAILPQLTALIERAQASLPRATARAALAPAPSRLVLDRAAAEIAGLTPEALRTMPAEDLNALAGRILDGAKAAQAAAAALPASPPGAAARVTQTDALLEVLASPPRSRALLQGLVGRRHARGIAGERFAELARRVYLEPGDSAKALSLAEQRRGVERAVERAAASWPEHARRLAGRAGAEQAGTRALAAAAALRAQPSLAQMEADPSLASGRDEALLSAIAGFEETLEAVDKRTISKAARRDVTRLLREARQLRAELALLKAAGDLSLATSEGIVRTRFFPLEAARLPQVADVAVVGAGPAGLSTALHAAELGLSPVVFDAGLVAQSFSDAFMKPVYRMRTPTTRNSLVQAPFSGGALAQELAMPNWLRVYRRRGQAADDALLAETGRTFRGSERAGLSGYDMLLPSARNELLQHYAHAAEELERKGGAVAERSPVVAARKLADGLWELTLRDGTRQLARRLVLAQGQVGTEAQNARMPADIDRTMTLMGHLTLRDRRDLVAKNPALAAVHAAERLAEPSGRQLVLHDSLLGAPEIERSIQWLKPGARALVLGSGESAAKSVLALLRLNPRISVTLLVKEELAQQQLQIPPHQAQPAAIEEALTSKAAAQRTLEEWKAFGSPITPATFADLQAEQKAGRVRVLAMGYKPTFHLPRERVEDPERTLRVKRVPSGTQLYDRHGVVVETFDGPMVVAVGYDRAKMRRDPLTQSLIDQGLLRVSGEAGHKLTENELALGEDMLSCAGQSTLFVVGAQNFGCAQDSAIPGMVARAAKVAAKLAEPPPYRASAAIPPGRVSFWKRLFGRR